MQSLSFAEIEKFASRRGVNKKAVENFLYTVGLTSSRDSALLNLYYDAVSCDWNIPTVKAIEAGINLAYSEDIERELATTSSIDTVSKGLSSKPQNCIACGKPASTGSYCSYCQEMREELRCWPKSERILSD